MVTPPHNLYSVFGRALAAGMPLPELASIGGSTAAWHVRESTAAPAPRPDAVLAGSDPLYAGVSARLLRHAAGWRIDVEDTGVFDFDAASATVTFHRHPGGTDDFFRAHLLGRVLATVLHDDGWFVAHASAVALGHGAVAFCAPKHSGKTTLALALAQAGGGLLTDDALPLERMPAGVRAWPGVHSARMRHDTLERIGSGTVSGERADGKLVVTGLAGELLATAAVPLAAVYVLVPAESIVGDAAVDRRQLPAPVAAAALAGQAKIARMLGPGAQPDLLRRAVAIAEAVPVYRLAVLRDYDRLPAVVEAIAGWHGGPVRSTA